MFFAELKADQGDLWWAKIKEFTHDRAFNFQDLTNKAFHLRTKSGLRPVSWAMLENYHDKNEAQVQLALRAYCTLVCSL